MKTQSAPNPPVSLGPILDIATTSLNQHSATPGPGITSAHLNSTGHIIVTLTNVKLGGLWAHSIGTPTILLFLLCSLQLLVRILRTDKIRSPPRPLCRQASYLSSSDIQRTNFC
ncbi:hypothetical protein LB505_006669 [Fusarium chuoi]|nr:hypothetical protein LB505_006669 [Fusarium chuoi]